VTDRAPTPELDPAAVGAFALGVWQYKQGEVVSLMIHLGDRLGLYAALDGAGPVTAAELAAKTELDERWLLEWLRGQAAAGLLVPTLELDLPRVAARCDLAERKASFLRVGQDELQVAQRHGVVAKEVARGAPSTP
jgi:hypothetical protein